jgi:hypothetical protein
LSSAMARRTLAAASLTVIAAVALVAPAAAHETREVGEHELVVGFIGEPVFTGQKSGLELLVTRGGDPVTGLAETLDAEVIYQGQRRELPLSPRFGEDGWYQSVFFPTAAGPYTFRIFGTIEGESVDESFTSSEEGFDEVNEATAGQFPIVLPTDAELAEDAAMALGGAGLLVGLTALVAALALRRRPA